MNVLFTSWNEGLKTDLTTNTYNKLNFERFAAIWQVTFTVIPIHIRS